MPISLPFIMCLMRNHRVGESPNLCKHTVSIDLFGGDISLLRLTRQLPSSPTWGRRGIGRAFEAVTAVTIEISYCRQVMRTDRFKVGSMLDIKTKRGRTICENSSSFLFQKDFLKKLLGLEGIISCYSSCQSCKPRWSCAEK